MRAIVAKRLRKLVYGQDDSPRFRKYSLFRGGHSLRTAYFIISDPQRRKYQRLKKEYLKCL